MIMWSLVGTVVIGMAGGGWYARDYIDTRLASKEEVQLAGNKADFVLDQQMAALIGQIGNLERKASKTASERQQLDYLRKQLDHMRKVRSGK